jgi:hypothetical protein
LAIVVVWNPDVATIHIEDVFATNGYRIVSLILLAYTLGKQPVQHAEIHMKRSILSAEIVQLPYSDAVTELIQLKIAPVPESDAHMLSR